MYPIDVFYFIRTDFLRARKIVERTFLQVPRKNDERYGENVGLKGTNNGKSCETHMIAAETSLVLSICLILNLLLWMLIRESKNQ